MQFVQFLFMGELGPYDSGTNFITKFERIIEI